MEETRLVNEAKETKENKQHEFTMVEILIYLYRINYSNIARMHNDDPRKYASLVFGDYQRIDKDVLKNICNVLDVSTDLVLNGLCKNMEPKVYISNINKWFTFDEYIMFRSIGAISDDLVFERRSFFKHEFKENKCSWLDLNKDNYIEQLKQKMIEGAVTIYQGSYPRPFGSSNIHRKSLEEQYEKIIKTVFIKYMDEEIFDNCLQRVKIKKLTDKLSIDIDLDKVNYTQDDLIKILNAWIEHKDSDNKDSVKEKSIENNSTNDKTVKVNPSESNQDTADNNDNSDK